VVVRSLGGDDDLFPGAEEMNCSPTSSATIRDGMVTAGSCPVMVRAPPGSLFTMITEVLYGGVTYRLGGRSSTIEPAVPAR
jgi:hypothetical protein